MANYVHTPFRNAVAGNTSDYTYSSVLTNLSTTLYSAFSDEADATTAATDVFQAVWTAGETPALSVKHALASVTFGPTVGTGVVDAADPVFTGAYVLPAGDPVENYFVFKFITNAAASPNVAHWDTATGLPLTPNGADVTVAISGSGLYKF